MTAYGLLIRRFALAVLVGFVSLWPTVRADQPPAMSRIGVLNPFGIATLEQSLQDELRQRGYMEGKNIVIDWRRSTGTEEELRQLAIELARSKADLIVALGSPATRAALQGTILPVVFLVGDPVATGFAASLAKPGGSGTGVSVLTPELNPKRLEFLHLIAPRARRIGLLTNSSNPLSSRSKEDVRTAARTLGIQIEVLDARNQRELETALNTIRHSPPDGLLVSAEAFFMASKAKISQTVHKARIPAIFPYREYHANGALISYGPDLNQVGHLMGVYVDKILKGAKPADLPIEQISKYQLIIDLRVAREIGITVPLELLLRADEVIR